MGGHRGSISAYEATEAQMTKRATDVIGLPVVSADTGKKLGKVVDLLLDENGTELIGLLVKHGVLQQEHVLPAAAVQSLGPDAIVSRIEELIGAKSWRERQDSQARQSPRGESS
jgi:uncharacterized protein YrrD